MADKKDTAFQELVTNSSRNNVVNITGLFRDGSDKDDSCPAGFLCVKNGALPNEGYPAGVFNGNSHYMKAASASNLLGTPIFACNPGQVNQVKDTATGNVFKVGANTLGLAIPAGERDTYTNIVFDGLHTYRFGIGNLSAALATNKFFTIANGLLVPAAAAPTTNGTPYFALIATGKFTEGAYAGMDCVDVEARAAFA